MGKDSGIQDFRKTSLPLILLVIVVLGVLYILTLASFLAGPPSAGFSREVAVDTLDYGFISNMQTPAVALVNTDRTLIIAAMDGHVTTIITTDGTGTVLEKFHLDLDLFKASQLEAYQPDEDTLVLFYVEGDLFKAVVNLRTKTFSKALVEPEVRSFVNNRNLLVLEKANGLFGYDTDLGRAPVPLATGVILDYAATIEDGACYVLAEVRNDEAMDLRAIVAGHDFAEIEDILILGNTRDNYLKTIQDVYVREQVLTGLFVWTDNKYGLNHLTVKQVDLRNGSIQSSFSNSFPIHKGRFMIDESTDGKMAVIMQARVHRGVNLVRATLEQGKEPAVVPLTKTRELSQLVDYFDIGSEKSLVFWDSIRTTRVLKYASTKAELIRSTTSLLTINYLSLLGVTLFVILVAAFIGTIPYLMFTSLAPLVLVLGLTRFSPDYRNKIVIQNGVGAIIGTVLKLYLTWHLIHGMGLFTFRPILIGREPVIYAALVASSVISWLIALVHLREDRKLESSALSSFVIYLFADYIQYIMMVLVYVASAMILDKI